VLLLPPWVPVISVPLLPPPLAAFPPAALLLPPAAQPAAPSQPATPAGGAGGQGAEYEAMVRRIMEMGFERTQVERALQVSYFNGDRAVDLLMMGVPIPEDAQGLQAMQSVLDAEMDDEDDDEGPPADAQQLFGMLRASPQFGQLRTLARTNPEMLEQVLSSLPQPILDLISQNQEEFLRLLMEDAPAGGAAAAGGGGGGAAPAVPQGPMGARVGGAAPPRGPQPGQRTFTLTPEDQAVINNLVDMGFDKQRVTEAYLLFERDAEMTANYLLNHGWDDLPGGPRFTGQKVI